LRLINAAADTTFDVALQGHRLTVTHSDGFPVRPVEVDTVRLSMGERYDALVTLADGVFPLMAAPLGKAGTPARTLIRTSSGRAPAASTLPGELQGRRLSLSDLVPDVSVRLPGGQPANVQDVLLGGGMTPYRWTINGTVYDKTRPLKVSAGEQVRLRLMNHTMMLHPMHLHGHTFAVTGAAGQVHGVRKDTVLVPPMQHVVLDLKADNPGAWMFHCHNAFHMAAGMMTRLEYTA
jgi:FtsP/CotA-like multicopper oxidase with cupredoxin domain